MLMCIEKVEYIRLRTRSQRSFPWNLSWNLFFTVKQELLDFDVHNMVPNQILSISFF